MKHRRIPAMAWLFGLLILPALDRAAHADQDGPCGSCDANDSAELRKHAGKSVGWKKHDHGRRHEDVDVRILGFNDFHGQLSKGRLVAGRPVGGAEVLASYLRAAEAGDQDETFIVHAGDHVGASPAASALNQDEPSISFLNMLDDDDDVKVIGTLGNHEFDDGRDELLRLLNGGNHASGPFLVKKWKGADFPYICSNVVEKATGDTLVPPYEVKSLGHGLKIAFIGAVLRGTPSIVTPSGVAGLDFLDEADSINACVKYLQKKKGIEAFVVQIHQGGFQTSYTGATSPTAGAVSGDILGIVSRLDDAVDVVVSGHTHAFTNAILNNANGTPILVTQAFSASTAYGDIRVLVDGCSGDIVEKSAFIQTTWGDEGPGLTPSADVAALVKAAEDKVAPLVNQVIGSTTTALNRTETTGGESALGNLIADAQRASMGTEFAFMNPGGIRADLDAGPVTWGELFTIQPFGNLVVKMELTGAQIKALLEQQWSIPGVPANGRILKTSGLTYTWQLSRPIGDRVTEIKKGGVALNPATTYTLVCNSFLATGGDGFTVFNLGMNRLGGPLDLDALIAYVQSLAQPFTVVLESRIVRVP